ncbi:MAG: hypothetical protein CL534_18940 [Ahrensia sp.]|nr:hypothetical protein [Ahrensia sp.]
MKLGKLAVIAMLSVGSFAQTAVAQQPPVSGAVKRSVTPLRADEFWLQVASREALPEAIAVAEQYKPDFPRTAVLQAPNGWYAIVVDVVKNGAVQDTLARMKASGLIPDDSYATPGKTFLWIAWPEVDPYAPVSSGN